VALTVGLVLPFLVIQWLEKSECTRVWVVEHENLYVLLLKRDVNGLLKKILWISVLSVQILHVRT
jgi:hypothetical protein